MRGEPLLQLPIGYVRRTAQSEPEGDPGDEVPACLCRIENAAAISEAALLFSKANRFASCCFQCFDPQYSLRNLLAAGISPSQERPRPAEDYLTARGLGTVVRIVGRPVAILGADGTQ